MGNTGNSQGSHLHFGVYYSQDGTYDKRRSRSDVAQSRPESIGGYQDFTAGEKYEFQD